MPGSVRRCNKSDLEHIEDLSGYAYSIPESSFEGFREKWDDICNEFFLNRVDDNSVASARLIPLIQNIRGCMKNMGAVGMVAGSPEYRRRGYTRELMLKMLEMIREDSYAVSCLYPFKDTFYGAMGYIKSPPTLFLELDPVNLKGISKPNQFTASRETGDDALTLWRQMHDSMVDRTHGAARRRDTRWSEYTKKFNRKIVVARNQDGEPEGVIVYSIKGYGEGHNWVETGEMNIGEFHWTSLEGRDTLLNFIYGHADQIKNVRTVISSVSEDYYQWLSDMHTPNISSNIVSMARIIDVKLALENIKVPCSGEAIIRIDDPHFAWNDRVFKFYEEAGVLKVDEVNGEANSHLTIEGLTAILYGTLDEPRLRRLGWMQGQEIPILKDWFPRMVPWLTENF